MDDTSGVETEVATNLTSRTDKSSYSIPEDGSPITISTQKITAGADGGRLSKHGRQKSQTSLLIEYFEASKTGDKSRPSVRVKVTPSAARKGKGGNDTVQITGLGKDRKPSYTRRISLGGRNLEPGQDIAEPGQSSSSNRYGRAPVEIEVLNNGSEMSNNRPSRGLPYAQLESNVSSMPPDSMLDGGVPSKEGRSRDVDSDDGDTFKSTDYLHAPARTRSRSNSRDRLTQKVMEKLGATTPTNSKPRKSSRSSQERGIDEYDDQPKERRRRSSKSQRLEDDAVSGADSSLASSNLAPSQRSNRSGNSQASRMTNNPKLLEMVEDTIKRMILPEINAAKEGQKSDRSRSSNGKARYSSVPPEDQMRESLERRVSKSSSSPNIISKPKVVLNRNADDPGTVLSRGDSERVKTRKSSRDSTENRPSSRRSSGRHSRGEDYDAEERSLHKSSRSSRGLRDTTEAGLAGGALTAAALKHHDSQEHMHERRKRRSKSRSNHSRSASIDDQGLGRKENIPPLPMASQIDDSDVTRESIQSHGTDRHRSSAPGEVHTPIREVSRGSLQDAASPISSRTPTRTSMSRGLGMSHTNQSIGSPRSPNGGKSTKDRIAALTAAGVGAAALARGSPDNHIDADGYGDGTTQRKVSSPVQSVSSLKKNFEEDESTAPQNSRPLSASARSPLGRLRDERNSPASLHSPDSPSSANLARSRGQSRNVSDYYTPVGDLSMESAREETGTPSGENMDEWFEREHQVNDRYRDSLDATTNRDSYMTNPYPQDEKRFTMFTDDSLEQPEADQSLDVGQKNIQPLNKGLNPEYVHTPLGVESAVASLMEHSAVSSNVYLPQASPTKANGSYSERMAEHLHSMAKDSPPAIYEGSTLSQNMTSQDRWAALRGHARAISTSTDDPGSRGSPRQSPAKSLREERSIDDKPVMGVSGLPKPNDPLPEIGHFNDTKSISTDPSVVEGPLGGDAAGNSTWPYTPEPERKRHSASGRSLKTGHSKEGAGLAAAAAVPAGILAAAAAADATRQPTVEDEKDEDTRQTSDLGRSREVNISRDSTPTGSPMAFRDEGYVTDGRTRSGGAVTPKAGQRYSKNDAEEYQRAMDAQDLGDDDPFSTNPRHDRHFSGNSHGMSSPLYDSATGTGLDRIQSKDIVALMDHLTVRDAQRNARDTEILVTLVRSATEMRSSFDEMKRFIVEQDKLIMQNTDRGAHQTAQKVLSGPRPQPMSTPRSSRVESQSEDDIQAKRKGVLRRALKGLTGGKSTRDLAKIEDMLMQILENVEDLKHQGGSSQPMDSSYGNDSMDSYVKLRSAPDPGYEPEGQAGTSSTPSQSGQFAVPPREKYLFHSGYDGRRGSEHRVSTVLEDDEDELEPHEAHVLAHQFENNEQMLTPTREFPRQRGFSSPADTPPRNSSSFNDRTPKTSERERKRKSNSSSLFGVPKISRWSKTTTSSAAPDPATFESPANLRSARPSSEASRSGSAIDRYDDDMYELGEDDRLRSTQSLARDNERGVGGAETRSIHSQGSRLTRTPSPLIPSETSRRDEYDDHDRAAASPIQEDWTNPEFDDPKYQAHRNSLLLQHPQPRQGPTGRYQNNLENQAQTFDDPTTGTNSDVSQRSVSDFDPAIWGSAGTAGLARHRLTQIEPITPVSLNSPRGGGVYGNRKSRDADPLVPSRQPPQYDQQNKSPPRRTTQQQHQQYHDPEPELDDEDEEDDEQDWDEPQFSNSGFSKAGSGGYYSSPYGSGHLLEPIEEVRYSLETDSGHVSLSIFLSFLSFPFLSFPFH